MAETKNEFDAAKAIVDALKGLQPEQQERAIKFAAESLSIKAHAPLHTPSTSGGVMGQAPVQGSRGEARTIDIKSFTEEKSPKSDQQFAAVVAYYYQFEAPEAAQLQSINAKVLANAARLVGRKRPSRHALNNAKRAGYVDATGGGEFRINTVGENLVAVTLPGGAERSVVRSTKRRSRKKAKGRKRK